MKIRFINVVDLMRLQDDTEHPHGLSHRDFDTLFTTDKPVVFAYHGYPWLVHRLTYRRTNHANLHVRGYKEEGTTSTPFDMVMMNDLDRFHLVIDVIDNVPALRLAGGAAAAGDGRRPGRGPPLHPGTRRRHPVGAGLDLGHNDSCRCATRGHQRRLHPRQISIGPNVTPDHQSRAGATSDPVGNNPDIDNRSSRLCPAAPEFTPVAGADENSCQGANSQNSHSRAMNFGGV